MTFTLTIARRNAMLDSLTASHANGYLRIYAGSLPANADAALGGATLLVEFRFQATAFPAASGGVLTANAISQVNATATGTAAFYRSFASDGTTVLGQGAVGTSGTEVVINSTAIVAAGPSVISSYSVSI